jgi:hypothetical protein
VGINQDLPAHLLPPEAWSDGRNIRFRDNKVVKMLGHSAVYDPPSITPYWVKGIQSSSEFLWIYAGKNKVYMVNSGGHTDITRTVGGDYSMDDDILWNGDLLGGVPILNNGVDAPQFWADTVPATKLADLTNWPASTTARVFRGFKNHLFALDVTKAGVRSPHMVKWSHPADPGTIPVSWDETDPTRDAGEKELDDTQAGFLLDALPLRDILIIYKENSVWGVQHIGGQFIFRFFKIFDSIGAMSAHCMGVFALGAQHFVHTGEDIVVHDGQRLESVLDRNMRKWLNNSISNATYKRSFVARNSPEKEMLFCFPSTGSTWCDLALAWSWQTGTASIRELDPASFISAGEILEGVTSDWDSDAEAWDADVTAWDQLKHRPQESRLLQADPVNTKLYFLDDTNQFNGVNMTSYIERTGIALVGKSRSGEPKVDFQSQKLITAIYPKARGGAFQIRVGGQEHIDGVVTYSTPQTFTPGVDEKVDVAVGGKLMAVRFESAADVAWELDGYDIDMNVLGRF